MDKHEVSLVFISSKNKKYEQKLFNDGPFFIEEDQGMIYYDNYVMEINGTYKVQDWNAEEEKLYFIDLFHPEMDFGKYTLFMKVTFPEHKKMFYSGKYILEYVPIEKTTNTTDETQEK